MRKKRRRKRAALLSGLFPGLGQWYNRQRGKGLLFGAIAIVLLLSYRVRFSTEKILLLLVVPYLGLWGYSIVDAWYGAKGAEKPQHGPLPASQTH
jgi:hypothetical protein